MLAQCWAKVHDVGLTLMSALCLSNVAPASADVPLGGQMSPFFQGIETNVPSYFLSVLNTAVMKLEIKLPLHVASRFK